ncbi:MAG TPA: hypothetical protein VI300_23690 [Solirubrobacter sp.]
MSCAVVACLLAVPAAAHAHPGVYEVTARLAKTAARQTISVDATGGTFKPSAGAASVPFDATAAQVQTALEADPAIGYDNAAVTGSGPYDVTFVGSLAGTAVARLVPDASGLTGGAHSATATVVSAGGADVTYASDPSGATMATQVQYVVNSDGYDLGFRETNGLGGGGLLNLKLLPTAYRAAMTPAQKLTYPLAQTGLQLHATCSGVAALADPANILAADLAGRTDGDPFYGYLPWQKDPAGIGDDPAHWIPVVKAATAGLPGAPPGGVDLSALTSAADFTRACQALGGTYHPADTASNVTTAVVADAVDAAVAPLNAQISAFSAQVNSLVPQLAALGSENAALKVAAPVTGPRTLRVTLTGRRLELARITAMVTGTPGRRATVEAQISTSAARALKLKSRTVARAAKTLDDRGAALVTLSAVKAAVKALAKTKSSIPTTISAAAGTDRGSAKATLTN